MGLKSDRMQYFVAQQEASNWCWAASVQMVLSAQGIETTQAEIVARASAGHVWDRPGTPVDFLVSLNGRMADSHGKPWQLAADVRLERPSFALMQQQFEQDLPLIIGYHVPGQPVGHAAVVTAVIYEWRDGEPFIHKILVRDPSPWLRASGGKRELTAAEFHRIWMHCLVTPQPL